MKWIPPAAATPIAEPNISTPHLAIEAIPIAPLEPPVPSISPEMASATLAPDKPIETVNPIGDQKIGPWGIHRTSTGVVIDRTFGATALKASGGIYISLVDENYGTLHVLISAEPKVFEPDAAPVEDETTEETAIQTEQGGASP